MFATLCTRLLLYCRLARLHQPAGVLLLLCPTLWGLVVAAQGAPPSKWLWVFVAGVVATRSLGCVVNDWCDASLDRHVRRTQNRPLAARAATRVEAAAVGIFFAIIAVWLWWLLPPAARLWSLPAAVFIFAYPFCKRFFVCPQAVLGVAFGFGILIASAVFHRTPTGETWCFFAANFLWVVAYDTLYAMSDRADDEAYNASHPHRRIYSSAMLFGRYDVKVVSCLYAAAIVLLSTTGIVFAYGVAYQVALVAAMVLVFRFYRVYKTRDSAACLAVFRANFLFGLCVLLGIVAAFV